MARIIRLISFFIFMTTLNISCGGPNICGDVNILPENSSWAILGDSIFAVNSDTCQYVAGNLSLNLDQRMPSYAEAGARLSNGEQTDVITQYEIAKSYAIERGTPLSTIIFDGCANDTIWEKNGACSNYNSQDCIDLINDEVQIFSDLIDQMKTDGVEYIVYVGIYNFQGSWAVFNPAMDQILDKIKLVSDDKGVGFVDLKPVFSGKYKRYLTFDNLHPNFLGSQAIAEAITTWLSK